MTTLMISLPSPPDPPAPSSALPSPPTSPSSPRAATTTRVRIKVPRRPDSLGNIPSPTSAEGHGKRMKNMSPSLSRIVTTDLDTPSSGNRTFALASTRAVAGKRRKPSITYYTPYSPSPWSQRSQLNRTSSSGVDGPHDGEPVMANGKENVSQRSSLVLDSRPPSTRESVCSLDGVGTREREPLTLIEKHADLLHFIAQKERKCLELRDQLAAHEKELAELKRKWECIVNRGYDPLTNPPLTAGLGGVNLDGLKEGVRIIAAGFSDLGGTIQELDSGNEHTKPKSLIHPPRENNNASNTRAKPSGSEHLSTSSTPSIRESVHASDHVFQGEEGETMATAPSLSSVGSFNCRVHKRASRAIVEEPTTPTSASVLPPAQKPRPANLDLGMSVILAPSPTLVPPLSASADSSRSSHTSSALGSTWAAVPMNVGPVSSWMGTMSKKLSGLQKGQTISKGQKQASLLLEGVSNTITSALLPGPTATTPAPAPMTTTPRILFSTIPPSTSPVSTKPSLTTLPCSLQPQPQPQPQSRPHPSCKTTIDWLDDDEEQQQTGGVLLIPDSKPQSVPVRTAGVTIEHGEATATTTGMSSFDDDDWNW